MKRLLVIMIICICICMLFVIPSTQVSSSMFDTAKKLAMAGEPDQHGNYFIRRDVVENGEQLTYVIGYVPSSKIVGGITIQGPLMGVVIFCEDDGTYHTSLYLGSQPIASEDITQEKAERLMQDILKHITPNAMEG